MRTQRTRPPRLWPGGRARHRGRLVALLFAAPLLAVPLLGAAAAGAAPTAASSGTTERVSVASDGAEGNYHSGWPEHGGTGQSAISADGRYVAFHSIATNLVPGDTNGKVLRSHVFVRDRETGVTGRVSVASDGTEANGGSSGPAISADGRHVAFYSDAANLVPGDNNGAGDVFVHDRESGVTERVSVGSDGIEGTGESLRPAISADGRHVAFYSFAANLVPGDNNGAGDVFVHDRETGTTERVSVASEDTEANGGSYGPAISADGRHVAFHSIATNLVPGDNNGAGDVFVHDRETGVTERVSVAYDGAEAEGDSTNLGWHRPAISADGRHVAFYSFAANLVPDDNGAGDVFVHDRENETTERVSVASDGTEAEAGSSGPAISADGRHVAFYSPAANLVPDDNGAGDVFVHDRETGVTERVSVASDGTEARGGSGSSYPGISADGRHVAFTSTATNLVPGRNHNWPGQVYARTRSVAQVARHLVYDGPEWEVRGQTVTLSATLSDQVGAPAPDRVLRFAMGGFEAEATTGQDGVATVEMPVEQPYGTHRVRVSFAGDGQLAPAEVSRPFSVLWEHRFADSTREVRVNTITNELQFAAPGDVSEVKTDPGMRVETLPTGEEMISVDYTDVDLTVVGRFFPDSGRFAATVRTSSNVYVLSRGI